MSILNKSIRPRPRPRPKL